MSKPVRSEVRIRLDDRDEGLLVSLQRDLGLKRSDTVRLALREYARSRGHLPNTSADRAQTASAA